MFQLYERPLAVWEENHLEECSKVNLFENKHVLEVGGITPKSQIELFQPKSWTCIDLWHPLSTESDQSYSVVHASINDYLFEPDCFDTIISTNCFEHIQNLEQALKNMYRVLKPGGHLSALFGPIWSCYKGHHNWIMRPENKILSFNDNIIPEWAHLLLEESELTEILKDKYPSDVVNEILFQTYHSEVINRMFQEDYIELINESGFEIIELRDWHTSKIPDIEVQKLLESKYKRKNFSTVSLKILLRK